MPRSPDRTGNGETLSDRRIFLANRQWKKITIMLAEVGLEYRIIPVNIGKGDQHTPGFTALSPNGKMPATATSAQRAWMPTLIRQ